MFSGGGAQCNCANKCVPKCRNEDSRGGQSTASGERRRLRKLKTVSLYFTLG
jgi:hypothetical protein